MAVVSVTERWDRRRSAIKDGRSTHERTFHVETDARSDGTPVALTADDGSTAIPDYGDAHPSDTSATVRDVEAEAMPESPLHFEVRVTYRDPEPSDTSFDADPLSRPPEIRWGGSETTEAYFSDINGDEVVNSANQSFDEFLQREAGEVLATFVRNESSFDAPTAFSYRHVVNSDTFVIDGHTISVGKAKMGTISAEKRTESGIDYYVVTYPIKLRDEGWDQTVLDAGYNELVDDGSGGKELKPILDADGQQVVKPYPLNSDGTKKSDPTTAASALAFQPYEEKSFAGFAFT